MPSPGHLADRGFNCCDRRLTTITDPDFVLTHRMGINGAGRSSCFVEAMTHLPRRNLCLTEEQTPTQQPPNSMAKIRSGLH
jgi:hypothetical protein